VLGAVNLGDNRCADNTDGNHFVAPVLALTPHRVLGAFQADVAFQFALRLPPSGCLLLFFRIVLADASFCFFVILVGHFRLAFVLVPDFLDFLRLLTLRLALAAQLLLALLFLFRSS
jgi:hypothetical protein